MTFFPPDHKTMNVRKEKTELIGKIAEGVGIKHKTMCRIVVESEWSVFDVKNPSVTVAGRILGDDGVPTRTWETFTIARVDTGRKLPDGTEITTQGPGWTIVGEMKNYVPVQKPVGRGGRIRKKILNLNMGDKITIDANVRTPQSIRAAASSVANSFGRKFVVTQDGVNVIVERVPLPPPDQRVTFSDRLREMEIGRSIGVPKSERSEYSCRVAASYIGRETSRKYSVSRSPEGCTIKRVS